MQLQVEHNSFPLASQQCWFCNESYAATEAKVIVCDNQGDSYGEVCPQCIGMGFPWLKQQFSQLIHHRNLSKKHSHQRSPKQDKLVGSL